MIHSSASDNSQKCKGDCRFQAWFFRLAALPIGMYRRNRSIPFRDRPPSDLS